MLCSYFRIHSVLGELSYNKGKVHKNSICQMQARQRKFDGYIHVLHISLPRRTIGNVYIFPVLVLNIFSIVYMERCMRISSRKYRSGKGNLFAACPVHFLTSRTIGNVYICPVLSTLIYCMKPSKFKVKSVLYFP